MKTGDKTGVGLPRMVRRRLIVDFFNLGLISRWSVCDKGGWLMDSDERRTKDQSFWASIFERAEKRGELGLMRELIDAETPNSVAHPQKSGMID